MTLKQLRAFVEVYRLGKLSSAAERLCVTQSAVSILLQQVESTLNTKLFDRTTRALVPTQAADYAITVAERILEGVNEFENQFRNRSELRQGRVRFAVTPSVGVALMPAAVTEFRRRYPHIGLAIEDCSPEQFTAVVLGGHVEFGIGSPEDGAGGEIERRPLLNDRLCLVCHLDHPLAKRTAVTWRDIEGLPLLVARRGYGVRLLIDRTAAQQGILLNIAAEVGFLTSILWMIASGLGVSILPTSLIKAQPGAGLALVPLVDPVVMRNVSIVTKRGRSLSSAGEAFVQVLTESLAVTHGN